MKTKFFKTATPFALVAMLGISGAFLTTSMQSSTSPAAPKTGYIDGPQGACSIAVDCNDVNNGFLCEADSQYALDKENGNCSNNLYRPQP